MPVVSVLLCSFPAIFKWGKETTQKSQSKVDVYKVPEQGTAHSWSCQKNFLPLKVLIELLTISFVSQMVYTHSCHARGPFKAPPRAFTFYRKELSTCAFLKKDHTAL